MRHVRFHSCASKTLAEQERSMDDKLMSLGNMEDWLRQQGHSGSISRLNTKVGPNSHCQAGILFNSEVASKYVRIVLWKLARQARTSSLCCLGCCCVLLVTLLIIVIFAGWNLVSMSTNKLLEQDPTWTPVMFPRCLFAKIKGTVDYSYFWPQGLELAVASSSGT